MFKNIKLILMMRSNYTINNVGCLILIISNSIIINTTIIKTNPAF